MARNVEIKARLSDYEDTARRARELSPSEPVVIAQEDVFFPCPS
ncbi:MAG: adenylate cyclase, partial [Roseibacillus sp.]|nr:adenylate cyclase [Roseibacillus sp.]